MSEAGEAGRLEVFTVGHSNVSQEAFIALLKTHGIEVLVDVRSAPYSKYVPHFNGDVLKQSAAGAGIKYLYLGRELGESRGRFPYSERCQGAAVADGWQLPADGRERIRVGCWT